MKRIMQVIICVVAVVGICAYCYRIKVVNSNLDIPVVKVYEKGQQVQYEDDFVESSDDSAEGYSVTVLDANIYTRKEFEDKLVDEYELQIPNDKKCDFFYVVDVKISNENKESDDMHGIYLYYLMLLGVNDFQMPDVDMTMAASSLPGMAFSLRPESDMDIKLIYTFSDENYKDIDEVRNADFKLMITKYPTKKLLKLK